MDVTLSNIVSRTGGLLQLARRRVVVRGGDGFRLIFYFRQILKRMKAFGISITDRYVIRYRSTSTARTHAANAHGFQACLCTVFLATTRIAPLAARSEQPPPSVSPASTFEIEACPPPRSGDQHARAERRVTQAEADGGAARCAAIGASRAAALAAVAAWLAPIYTPRPGAGMREEQRWPPARRFSLYENTGGAHMF